MWRTFKPRIIACVLDRKPTAAEPCFTASSEYSTWCSRPCGEKTVLSESYVFRNYFMLDMYAYWPKNTHHGGLRESSVNATETRVFDAPRADASQRAWT